MAVEGSMMVVTPVSLAAKNMNAPKARTGIPQAFFVLKRKMWVSYQCHTNCDEWRQKVNKDRKEKVNLTTPI